TAKAAAEALDADLYTEASYQAVTDAVAAVVEGKFESQQAEVDAMAKAINDAIDALVEKTVVLADYTAVDAAIATIPADLSIYTDESVAAVTSAVNAVVRNKPASEQAAVDAMAQAIVDAVAGLVKKQTPGPGPGPQPVVTIETVRAAIKALDPDPSTYKKSDKTAVEAILADFNKLSAADQATLDSETSHPASGQPLGRVLESAVWAVRSYDPVDNSTTLADGTYDSTTVPKLTSTFSSGKSTSGKATWSVKSVTVVNGKATATLAVSSSTYDKIWIGGKEYPKTNTSGNSEFAGVPVDLNSVFYFAGYSSSMKTYIAYSMTTAILEPAPPQHEHKLTKVTAKAATCTEAGFEEYWICSECKNMYSDEKAENQIEKPVEIPALGHDFTKLKESAEPGFGTEGYKLYECAHKCGETKKETTPSLKAQAEEAIKAVSDAAAAVKTPEDLAKAKELAEEADKKVAAAEKAAGSADQAQLEELKKANAAAQEKAAGAEAEIKKSVMDAAEAAEKKAAGYTEADYKAESVEAIQTALKALSEAKAGTDLVKIQTATKALNDAIEAAEEKKSTTIKILKKSNKKTVKAGGKALKKKKTFTVKTKASSGAKTTYKKVGKGKKKITINSKGKVTLKKGLKKGKYTIKVKVSAKPTKEAKGATRTIKVTIRVK
ncbi:MAG: hypothetical protein IKF07_01120, partial [Eubacterium sp.]|nr:hypothetical protein [Eubacterium sp.]